MSIHRVKCPNCGTSANVPVAMATVRCPKCTKIWNPNAAEEEDGDGEAPTNPKQKRTKTSSRTGLTKIVGGVVASVLIAAIVGGTGWYLLSNESRTESNTVAPIRAAATAAVTPEPDPVVEPYREIKLSESVRQQIYRDYRKAANSSVDKPIPLPKKWNSRQALDATMDQILEREITLHATSHNISNEDVVEVIKEGNAKKW